MYSDLFRFLDFDAYLTVNCTETTTDKPRSEQPAYDFLSIERRF